METGSRLRPPTLLQQLPACFPPPGQGPYSSLLSTALPYSPSTSTPGSMHSTPYHPLPSKTNLLLCHPPPWSSSSLLGPRGEQCHPPLLHVTAAPVRLVNCSKQLSLRGQHWGAESRAAVCNTHTVNQRASLSPGCSTSELPANTPGPAWPLQLFGE